MEAEPPLSDCLDSFWSEGTGHRPLPGAGQPAPRRLTRPDITIRGRNLATLLAPAYDAFARRETDSPWSSDPSSETGR